MDRYEKIRTIGRGQFGEAVLCRDLKSRRGDKVVVKRVSIELMTRTERKQALAEVTLLSSLKHPNVVIYHGSFMMGEDLHIVMEYCSFGDLGRYLQAAKNPIPEPQVLDWFIQLSMACRYIHSRKILHRDLKSNNVFITRHNILKLGDFGIARVLSNTLEHANTVVGTPYYMSPEVCENKPYSYKSDLWAVGCILYEMCTRKHAFHGSNLLGLVYQIVQGKYSPLPEGYSPGMTELVKSLLTQDPRERADYATIFAMPVMRKHIAELERTGGSIGQRLRRSKGGRTSNSSSNSRNSLSNETSRKSKQDRGVTKSSTEDDTLTPSERARRRKQRKKELARELREAELRAAALEKDDQRSAVAERKRRMFRSTAGSGLNFAVDAEKDGQPAMAIGVGVVSGKGSPQNYDSRYNRNNSGRAIHSPVVQNCEVDNDTHNTITVTSMTDTRRTAPLPFNTMSGTMTSTLDVSERGLYTSIDFCGDTTDTSIYPASGGFDTAFGDGGDDGETKGGGGGGGGGGGRKTLHESAERALMASDLLGVEGDGKSSSIVPPGGRDPFAESNNRMGWVRNTTSNNVISAIGNENIVSKATNGTTESTRHNPNDERPIHGSIGGRYDLDNLEANTAAAASPPPTSSRNYIKRSSSGNKLRNFEGKISSPSLLGRREAAGMRKSSRKQPYIDPDERPINPSPQGSVYSPYDEEKSRPSTANTAAVVAAMEAEKLPGDPGSPVKKFRFEGSQLSGSSSSSEMKKKNAKRRLGRGFRSSRGGRASGRSGRTRGSSGGGRSGRTVTEGKVRSNVSSSSSKYRERGNEMDFGEAEISAGNQILSPNITEGKHKNNEGKETQQHVESQINTPRSPSPSYMMSGEDDDDLYSDEDEVGGLYSDDEDFEDSDDAAAAERKSESGIAADEVLAHLRSLKASVEVQELPESDIRPFIGMRADQIRRFESELEARGGRHLYNKVRNFLEARESKTGQLEDGTNNKRALEKEFGANKLDFCFQVEQLLYLQKQCANVK
eukprot:g2275.t1